MRSDGRKVDELRSPLKLRVGVLTEATGSAYLEWGGNRIIVGVFGPKDAPPHFTRPDKATLRVDYKMSTFSSKEEHGRSAPSRRSIEISKVLREALSKIVMLEKYPQSQIDIHILVLQAEGGTRVASFYAAVAALIAAGIPMRTRAFGISAGKVNDEIVLDLSKEEDNLGQADIPVCMDMDGNVLLFQLDGKVKPEELKKAFELIEGKKEFFDKMLREEFEKFYSQEISHEFRVKE